MGGMMPRWSVDIIGKRLQHLGTVVANDERKALEEAIKQFAVRPALRSKIAVTKVADND
jgi:1,2-phenylacetyl-CoA epoxidase PaaB subunit